MMFNLIFKSEKYYVRHNGKTRIFFTLAGALRYIKYVSEA